MKISPDLISLVVLDEIEISSGLEFEDFKKDLISLKIDGVMKINNK